MGAWDGYERREEVKEIEINFATMLNTSQSVRKPRKKGQEPRSGVGFLVPFYSAQDCCQHYFEVGL